MHATLVSNQGRRHFIPTVSIDFAPYWSPLSAAQPTSDLHSTATLWVRSIRFVWLNSPIPKQWTKGELGEFSQRARKLAHFQSIVHRFEARAHAVEFAKAYGEELASAENTKCLYRISEDGKYVEYPLSKTTPSHVPMHASVDYTQLE